MKIKCPCNCEFTTNHGAAHLHDHLYNEHDDQVTTLVLSQLTMKIHERIESLQSEIKGNHFEDCNSGHDFETHQNIEFAIYELKSLLDNEK